VLATFSDDCALTMTNLGTLDRSGSPGLGRVTLRLPKLNQSEGDGLASDLTRSVSRSHANTGRVTRPASYPTPVELVGRR
jgi:hypothetical protein